MVEGLIVSAGHCNPPPSPCGLCTAKRLPCQLRHSDPNNRRISCNVELFEQRRTASVILVEARSRLCPATGYAARTFLPPAPADTRTAGGPPASRPPPALSEAMQRRSSWRTWRPSPPSPLRTLQFPGLDCEFEDSDALHLQTLRATRSTSHCASISVSAPPSKFSPLLTWHARNTSHAGAGALLTCNLERESVEFAILSYAYLI